MSFKHAEFKLIAVGLLATVGLGQSQDVDSPFRPEFEVASIKPDGQMNPRLEWMQGGRFLAGGVTARLLIGVAYRVKDFQILGGPSWIGRDQYAIEAKGVPSRKGPILSLYLTRQQKELEEANLKIQSLPAERFQLRVHREIREEQVYSLVVAKNGPKFQKSKFDESALAKGMMPGLQMRPYELVGTSVSIHYLAEELSRRLIRNVVDQTGLDGEYDFNLRWVPDVGDGDSPPDGPSIFTALQEQLGLKLESGKAPVEALVIDHIERPSEN